MAQLRGLKDTLKSNCCKEFPCRAAHPCPLKEIPLFSGAVSAAGEQDLVPGMSSRGSRKDNPVTIFFSPGAVTGCVWKTKLIILVLKEAISPEGTLEDDACVPGKLSCFSWLLLPLPPLGQSVSLSQTWCAAPAKLHSILPLSSISYAETSSKAELCVSFEIQKKKSCDGDKEVDPQLISTCELIWA